MHEVVEPLRQLALDGGVRLHLSAPPEDAALHADPLRLRQILINLIGNAIKFSDRRGDVYVSVTQEADSYLFQVRDQGVGIAPENLERVFRSFEQVDQGDTRRFGGTGLGLSIAKSLVEMHGGQIWVTSTLGQGASFFVRLPAQGPSHMAAPAGARPALDSLEAEARA
jgi:signal transduction histidine kinase